MGNGCPPAYYGSQAGQVPSRRKRYYVEFDGDSSFINCGSDASLDNLHANNFTVDGWINPQSVASIILARKFTLPGTNGWELWTNGRFYSYAAYDIDIALTISNQTFTLNTWTHVVMAFNKVADGRIYLAIGGQWCTYALQQAYNGAIQGDAGDLFLIGQSVGAEWWDGYVSWLRVSSGIRYPIGVAFTPSARCIPPAVDASTIELWEMDEGAGAVTAASVVAANQGAMTDCAWHKCK